MTSPPLPAAVAKKSRLGYWVSGAALFALWVLLSGKFEFFHLAAGLVSVASALFFHARLPVLESSDAAVVKVLRIFPYLGWLIVQMILSAIHVAGVILRPAGRLNPRLLTFHSEQPSLLQSVLFANSITLTPGTLTIELQNRRYLVHALTADTARDLLSGEMAARVANLSAGSRRLSPSEAIKPEETGPKP